MAPYAHPHQHMKVSKHLLYDGTGCGTHFMLILSLNCVICTGFQHRAPISIWVNTCGDNSLMIVLYVTHPQHMRIVKHLLYDGTLGQDVGTISCWVRASAIAKFLCHL
jgi:hypothetical protein